MWTALVCMAAVSIVIAIVYVLERKSQEMPIVWEHLLKLVGFGSILVGGVVFATSDGTIEIPKEMPTVDGEMFVGTPSF